MTLLDLGAIRHELKQLLGVPIDVLTPGSLPASFRDRVLSEEVQVGEFALLHTKHDLQRADPAR